MRSVIAQLAATGLFLVGCGGVRQAPAAQYVPASSTGAPSSQARPTHTAADVRFMSAMIHHHAQAIQIAGWIPTHDANATLRRLGERIVVGQRDEIAIMERWLQDRNEPIPGSDSTHAPGHDTTHNASHHSTSMPGMLSAEQLTRLDQARDQAFDRLFLEYMIIHHRGAITMVDQLMDAPGAAQDDTVFRLASDIHAEQTNEINRMQKMLDALPPVQSTP